MSGLRGWFCFVSSESEVATPIWGGDTGVTCKILAIGSGSGFEIRELVVELVSWQWFCGVRHPWMKLMAVHARRCLWLRSYRLLPLSCDRNAFWPWMQRAGGICRAVRSMFVRMRAQVRCVYI